MSEKKSKDFKCIIHTEVAETVSRKTATATTTPNIAIVTNLRSRLIVDEAFIDEVLPPLSSNNT